jgi:3-deoxy-7-phosphoheptulonate synthase
MTMNFVRALLDGGFADLHHPEHWDLSVRAERRAPLSQDVEALVHRSPSSRELASALRVMENRGEKAVDPSLTHASSFFTRRTRGCCLPYEVRADPQRRQARRALQRRGAPPVDRRADPLSWAARHVEYFRGLQQPRSG